MRLIFLKLLTLIALFLTACSDPAKEMPELLKQLNSREIKVRNKAALRIGQIGTPHADQATKTLIRLLNDPNPGVQSSAAYALRQIDSPEAKKALELAIK